MAFKKITPSREDVLKVFTEEEGKEYKPGLTRPLGVVDIAREIAEARGGDWYKPYDLLSRDGLKLLLEEMTADRTLTMRLGREWRTDREINFQDQRNENRYWTTSERAEQWDRERKARNQAAEEKKHRQEADRYARECLVSRYRKEYDELVEEYHNGARLAE